MLDKLPPTQARREADNARTITEITTPIEGVLEVNNSRVENVPNKVWLLLNQLLRCDHPTAKFDRLCEQIIDDDGSTLAPVWGEAPKRLAAVAERRRSGARLGFGAREPGDTGGS